MQQAYQNSLFSPSGERKYLTQAERLSFLSASSKSDEAVRMFCLIIAFSGCRISEALHLKSGNIDFETGQVVIHSLKKRGRLMYRGVPLPSELLERLRWGIHSGVLGRDRLWPWSRMTGYRRICEVMLEAGISGGYATPRGLRHGFGVSAIQAGVPLNLVQRWLGHADIKTTAIYTDVMGPEERQIASRMWLPRTDSRKIFGAGR